MVRGSVDTVTETVVTGWVYSPGRTAPVSVQAVLNHEILGETTASNHRPDLKEAGLGDGNSGFEIKLYREIDPLYVPFVRVTVDGGDAELPRAPFLGVKDFLQSLFAQHPTAGRSRSMFGGLWTDRTDASAVLAGKARIGQIPAALHAALERFIHSGFVVLDAPSLADASELSWMEDAASQTKRLSSEPAVRELLKSIFEDTSVVLGSIWVRDGRTPIVQPSAANPSPAMTECVHVVIPLSRDVWLDIVRDSHMLPEFNANAKSRWTDRASSKAGHPAIDQGFIHRQKLERGEVAIAGPGLVYSVSCLGDGERAVQIACVPTRCVPASMFA